MEMRKWKMTELPETQQSILRQLYGRQIDMERGYSPNQILYVRELTDQELELMGRGGSGSRIQLLYKLKGTVMPPQFNRALYHMVQQEERLRLNYCPVDEKTLAVVFNERREPPEVIYRNLDTTQEDLDSTLRKLMEADMRQDFDPRHGNLVRFAVFHTGADEYAVLVSAVQAVLEGFDVRSVFRMALGEKVPGKQQAISGMPQELKMEELAAPVVQYWTQILSDLPPLPRLPYAQQAKSPSHKQQAYPTRLSGHILSDLKEQAKSNKMMLMSILQTAWGILLQDCNDCEDVAFCLMVPRREGKGYRSIGAQSMVPVRLRTEGDITVQEVVAKAFQQFVVSQPYASLGRKEIREMLNLQGENFDHFLNFCDFLAEGEKYSTATAEPQGKLVAQNTWDAKDIRLGIGFRYEEDQVAISFLYDMEQFTIEGIKLLVQQYHLVLQQMLTDWNRAYAAFRERLDKRWTMEQEAKRTQKIDSRALLQDALSRLPLLQECEEGIIQMFMQDAKISVYFEGDRISGKAIEEQLVFVVDGLVSRCIETGDGWYNALDIMKESSWVNETVLLPNHKTQLSAEVLTEQATIMTIPLIAVQGFLAKSPILGRNIIQHTIRQMEKYQRLWIQS